MLCAVCNASEAAVICPVAKLMEVWRLHVTVQTNNSRTGEPTPSLDNIFTRDVNVISVWLTDSDIKILTKNFVKFH